MSKTAYRRHQHARYMRRRLRFRLWRWGAADPKVRNQAARNTRLCSCHRCRYWTRLNAKHKQQRADTWLLGRRRAHNIANEPIV